MNNLKSIINYQVFSAIFVAIVGTLLHFLFEWSNNNYIVGAISAVNESTWEHLKILFFPMLLTTIVGYFIYRKTFSNFICAKTIGIISAMAFIIIFFYTYTGIVGDNFAFLDILSFFVAIIIGEFISYIILRNNIECNKTISVIILLILTLGFVFFTFNPPKIGLFQDPISGGYGIDSMSLPIQTINQISYRSFIN